MSMPTARQPLPRAGSTPRFPGCWPPSGRTRAAVDCRSISLRPDAVADEGASDRLFPTLEQRLFPLPHRKRCVRWLHPSSKCVVCNQGSVVYLALEILVVPGREFLGVVEDLPDHFPTRLRIPPELELRQDQSTERVDVQGVHVARRRGQLAADGYRIRVASMAAIGNERGNLKRRSSSEDSSMPPADTGLPSGIRRSISSWN